MASTDGWPVANFHFRVRIGAGSTISFQEIIGLEQEAAVLEYRHGKRKSLTTMKRTGLMQTKPLVFKKGIFKSDKSLTQLFNKINEHGYSPSKGEPVAEMLIELVDELSNTVVSWNIINAIPTKLICSDLKSHSNDVAIESMEWVHEGIEVSVS